MPSRSAPNEETDRSTDSSDRRLRSALPCGVST
jgi:hypothetical protein